MPKSEIIISGTDNTKAAFDSARRGMGSIKGALGALAAAGAAVAGAGALGAVVKAGLETGDTLAKTADRIGVTTKSLAALRHGAQLAGSSSDGMDKALIKLNKSLSEAAQGTGIAAKEIESLGLDAGKLAQLPVDQAMAEIAEAMAGIDNQADKARISMNLMGRSGAEMINVMAGGREGFARMAEEAEALGINLDRVSAAQIEGANDEMARLRAIASGAAQRLAAELAPTISAVSSLIKDAAASSGGFQGAIERAGEIGGKAVGILADTWQGLKMVIKGVELAVKTGMSAAAATIDGFVNGTIDLLNKIPGVNIEPVNTLAAWAEVAAGEVLQVEGELKRLAAEGLPSEEIAKRIAEFKAKAAEVAANAPTAAAVIPDGAAALEGPTGEEEKERERLAAKLETLRASLLTEEEALIEARDRKLALLEEGREADLISETEYKAQLAAVSEAHEKKIYTMTVEAKKRQLAVERMANLGTISGALGAFAALAAAADKHNKGLFFAIKAARISQAVVDTYAGAANALATVPYPFNFAAAAAVVAAGLANVATITSTGFGSGGGGGGGGASAPTIPGGGGGGVSPAAAGPPTLPTEAAQPAPRTPTNVVLNLGDDALLNGKGLRNLIDKITETHADGYTLQIAGGAA